MSLKILMVFSNSNYDNEKLLDKNFIQNLSYLYKGNSPYFYDIVRYFKKENNKKIFFKKINSIIQKIIIRHQESETSKYKMYLEHCVSAILYLSIHIDNKENSNEKKMLLIKNIYNTNDTIENLFIFGDFFPLDFTNTTIVSSKFDSYGEFVKSKFSNTTFKNTQIINLPENINNDFLKSFNENVDMDRNCEHDRVLDDINQTSKKDIIKIKFKTFLRDKLFLKRIPYQVHRGEKNHFIEVLLKYEVLEIERYDKYNTYSIKKQYNSIVDTFINNNRLNKVLIKCIESLCEEEDIEL